MPEFDAIADRRTITLKGGGELSLSWAAVTHRGMRRELNQDAVLAEDLAANDVFVLSERLCGERLGVADISVEAVNADPHSAALLQVPDGAALLMVERLAHLEDGRPVDLEYIRFRGDRV